MSFSPEEQAFLRDLHQLSIRHGIVIWGCGCCGSPSLIPLEGPTEGAGYGEGGSEGFRWLAPGKYGHAKYKDTIVK